DFGDRQQPLYASKVDSAVVDQPFDYLKPIELLARVEPHAADGSRRLHQAEALIFTESLWMHAQHPRRHADEIKVHKVAPIRVCDLIRTVSTSLGDNNGSVSGERSPDRRLARRARGFAERRQRDGPGRAGARPSEK